LTPVVKILDMGLARWQGLGEKERGVTQVGAVIGTPAYLAPEQAVDARAADIRADLYSLGCTWYYLLTGQPPFEAASFTELLLKHQFEQATPVERRRPDVPPGVAALLRKLMAKRPEDRFQTPAELIDALATCFNGTCDVVPLTLPARREMDALENPWATIDEGDSLPGCTAPATGAIVEPGRKGVSRHGPPTRATGNVRGRARMALVAGSLVAASLVAVVLFVVLGRSPPKQPAPPSKQRAEHKPKEHQVLATTPKVDRAPQPGPEEQPDVAPRQLAPTDGSVFDHFPRKTTLRWAPVAGAAKYKVEIEYLSGGKWDSLIRTEVRLTEHELNFLGAQPGRWRIWAVEDSGQEGPKSDWWTFRYTQ
jgi:hypothetical protein